MWRARRDSNPRPLPSEGSYLVFTANDSHRQPQLTTLEKPGTWSLVVFFLINNNPYCNYLSHRPASTVRP